MSKYSVFNVAVQVEQMRIAQKLYFIQSAKGRKTKTPEDFAEAKRVLNISKHLEQCVDETIQEIYSEGMEVQP